MYNDKGEVFYIDRISENKIRDLENLYRVVYKHKPSQHFSRKYNTAYTGLSYTGYIAYNTENIPVAYFGAVPCFIKYNCELILSAQASDAMTHPLYRNKGIFEKLAKLTTRLCMSEGVKLLFGFPNQNSYHGLVNKLGWKTTGNMERFFIPVQKFSAESLLKKMHAGFLYAQYAKWILRKYLLSEPGIESSAAEHDFGFIYRDAKYLKYRNYSSTRVIKIGHAKLWFKINNGLVIGDIEIAEDEFNTIIEQIKKLAKKLFAQGISFQLTPGTKLYSLFAARFKAETSFPVIFFTVDSSIAADKIKFTFADTDIF